MLTIDSVGAMASKRFSFPYTRLAVLSYAAYATTGAISAETGSLMASLIDGGVVGLVDSTVGWWLSWRIGPGAPPHESRSFPKLVLASISVVCVASLISALAGLCHWLDGMKPMSSPLARGPGSLGVCRGL